LASSMSKSMADVAAREANEPARRVDPDLLE
jgi:hypothetical protein